MSQELLPNMAASPSLSRTVSSIFEQSQDIYRPELLADQIQNGMHIRDQGCYLNGESVTPL
jgi:hypothetical protein